MDTQNPSRRPVRKKKAGALADSLKAQSGDRNRDIA
jgi:hypothetical protein